jgi:signal peptidase II
MAPVSLARMPDTGARWWRWLIVSAGVVGLDQVTKHLAQQVLTYGRTLEVTPFFNLVLVYNPGAAFSFLSSAPGWQRELFIGIALAASALIVYLLRKHAQDRMFCFALALILGGALGNLIDRFLLHAVVDFLDFHLLGRHWPAFNLADSAITLGAGVLIWDTLRRPRMSDAAKP